MKNNLADRSRAFAIATLFLLVTSACGERPHPTAVPQLTPVAANHYVSSEHFYQGSDGYYYWDGQPPPG